MLIYNVPDKAALVMRCSDRKNDACSEYMLKKIKRFTIFYTSYKSRKFYTSYKSRKTTLDSCLNFGAINQKWTKQRP